LEVFILLPLGLVSRPCLVEGVLSSGSSYLLRIIRFIIVLGTPPMCRSGQGMGLFHISCFAFEFLGDFRCDDSALGHSSLHCQAKCDWLA
jgi:hypothetical protein